METNNIKLVLTKVLEDAVKEKDVLTFNLYENNNGEFLINLTQPSKKFDSWLEPFKNYEEFITTKRPQYTKDCVGAFAGTVAEHILKMNRMIMNYLCEKHPEKSDLNYKHHFEKKEQQPIVDIQPTEAAQKKINDIIKKDQDVIKKAVQKEYENKIYKYYENTLNVYNNHHFFYDSSCLFWMWNKEEFKYEIIDDTDLILLISKENGFNGRITTNPHKSKYIDTAKAIGRQHKPKEPLKNWVQFKDKIFDIITEQTFEATPEYFFINPVPWKLGDNDTTPEIDSLFRQWVEPKYITTLYEIMAYCCYRDYPIHLIFCLYGPGMNGKGVYQKLLLKFFGMGNICSAELDDLTNSRFGSFSLYKKLICQMGETNFGIMEKTSLLKKLAGGDLIQFEYKNKMPFTENNYAKIIINTNSLPTSQDTSDGFYRRWLIIPFLNNFEKTEIANLIDKIPEYEFENLARKLVNILPILLGTNKITNQGTIQQQKEDYVSASNPLPLFIRDYCEQGDPDDYFVRYSELFKAYTFYLNINKKRLIGKHEFGKTLERECFEVRYTSKKIDGFNWYKDRWIEGLKLKKVL